MPLPMDDPKPNSVLRRLLKCPLCLCSVREDRLDAHLRRVHQLRRAGKSAASEDAHAGPGRVSDQEAAECALEEAGEAACVADGDHESNYGDKGMGQWAHDPAGGFGSMPLYDDYGDESDAG